MPRKVKGLLFRKSQPAEEFSVRAAWNRIKAWNKAHRPDQTEILNPPASVTALRAFEKAIGQKLPPDVVESYRVHDGQNDDPHFHASLLYSAPLLSLKDALLQWRRLERHRRLPEIQAYFREHEVTGKSFPENAIRMTCLNAGWLPLSPDYGGNYLGVDLDPGPSGTWGQVIVFGRDYPEFDNQFVLARSWGQFLEDIADELERGNFLLGNGRDMDLLCLASPPRNLRGAAGAWSLAKLGVRRLANRQRWLTKYLTGARTGKLWLG
jgi:cell wall assembly regulator SMI1